MAFMEFWMVAKWDLSLLWNCDTFHASLQTNLNIRSVSYDYKDFDISFLLGEFCNEKLIKHFTRTYCLLGGFGWLASAWCTSPPQSTFDDQRTGDPLTREKKVKTDSTWRWVFNFWALISTLALQWAHFWKGRKLFDGVVGVKGGQTVCLWKN